MQYNRLIIIARAAQANFSDILSEPPKIFDDKVRLYFIDGSFMEIRYPLDTKYSFHWQRASNIFRVDTAPHHKRLSTHPRHIHIGDRVLEDAITVDRKIILSSLISTFQYFLFIFLTVVH
ncbi:MAG: DUF6516 family protein [Methanosarcinales archaeon]